MSAPVLESIFEQCKYEAPVGLAQRDICFDGILCLLLSQGLLSILPELKLWLNTGPEHITVKKNDLEQLLINFAKGRQLDSFKSQHIAAMIAKYINQYNISSIVDELDAMENPPCKEKKLDDECKETL